ncbi:domain-containing histone demethylation 3D [Zalerion maritima]|uniref:Domain-containing histone demethylation 3D n=1 Tax=Zalerion maritima TaxID=339359 RepID=A0AAD5RMF2_9PEZI|nr:domain-containing histone demethylation 3D [Zalerion maritima]
MDASTQFHDAVSGQYTIAAPQASYGGSNNFHFHVPAAANDRNPPKPRKPFSTVPFPPDPDFVDRPDILKWIHEKCTRPTARIALVGLGGIGKSQLAIRYAHQVRQHSPNTWVFWVHASTRGRFEEAYESIADRLELPRRNDPKTNIFRLVSEWLRIEENGRWIMILDNADDANVFFSATSEKLATFLPQTCNGSIIVTSRSMNVAERLVGGRSNIHEVPAMKTEEACQLLREKFQVGYEAGAAVGLDDTDQEEHDTNQEEHDTDQDKEHDQLDKLLDGQRDDPEDTSAVSSPPDDLESISTVSSPSTTKTEGDPTFILERDQLGDRMPETLCNLSKTGFEKASAPWIREESLDPDIKSLLVLEDDPDVKFNIFETRKDGGMHVYKDNPEEGREFEWPSFDEESEPPTEAQALDDLERFISNPPDKQVPYYNGIMKSTLYDLCPLYPGKTLAEIDPSILTHVNQTYTHLGGKGSATPMHKEDGNLRSANVCFIGAKLWTKIAMTDNDKFENWVRANNPNCKPCPQFVRHLSIFFALSQLKAAGIAFTTFIQYPGEFIDTRPDEHHQVFNLLTSLAISTNYLAPSETPSFFDEDQPLEVCDECCLKPLYGKEGFHIRLVHSSNDATTVSGRKRKAPVLANTSKRRRDWADAVPQESPRTAANLSSIENDASEEAQKQQATLRKMKEHCRSGRFVVPLTLDTNVADRVCRLALAIVSRDAVKQFAEAVEHSMRPAKDCKRKPLHALELKAKDGDPEYIPIARRSMQMDATQKRTHFDRITNRYD